MLFTFHSIAQTAVTKVSGRELAVNMNLDFGEFA